MPQSFKAKISKCNPEYKLSQGGFAKQTKLTFITTLIFQSKEKMGELENKGARPTTKERDARGPLQKDEAP